MPFALVRGRCLQTRAPPSDSPRGRAPGASAAGSGIPPRSGRATGAKAPARRARHRGAIMRIDGGKA
eukprot:7558968-Pyramimonas_sp.AAC.1